jgi:branched-chain amino acid transport system substrate-binding protein
MSIKLLNNMKSSRIKWLVGIVIIAIVAIVIFGSGKTSSGTIKVGVIAPLSGQYGSLGESFKNAVILAAGDDKRIQVVFEDDKFDAKTGLSAFQKLTNIDHLDLVINESSPTLGAITPIVNESHIPVIQIFEAKEHNKDSIFQMLPFSYPLFSDLAKLAEQHYNRIALVYNGDSDVFVTDADYFKQGVISSSTIVNQSKLLSSSDFRSEVTKILASSPDAVTIFLPSGDIIKFIKEFSVQKGNMKIDLICDANTELSIGDYVKALGASVFEGCLSTNLPSLTTESFIQTYSKRFNANPLPGADWGYDAMSVVKDLLNTPKDKWIKKIQSESFDGVSGHVSFDENGTRNSISERHVFRDGKFVKI